MIFVIISNTNGASFECINGVNMQIKKLTNITALSCTLLFAGSSYAEDQKKYSASILWPKSGLIKQINISQGSDKQHLKLNNNLSSHQVILKNGIVKYEILFEQSPDSNADLGSDAPLATPVRATATGRINLDTISKTPSVTSNPLDIHYAENIKTKIKCEPKVQRDEKGLTIDFSHLESIAKCSGKGLKLYDIDSIAKRDISKGANFFRPEDDVALGEQFKTEYNNSNEVKELILGPNHKMTQYLQQKMDELASKSDSQIGSTTFKPTVFVINADVINAFALPGGVVYVYRGLIDNAPNEAAVMGVLGHEWAHVTARHGTRNITRAITTYLVAQLFLLAGDIASNSTRKPSMKLVYSILGLAGFTGSQLMLLQKSRKAELEADRIGSQYAFNAGYSPMGLVSMFEVFKKKAPYPNGMAKMLASHPDHDHRIEQINLLSSMFYTKQPGSLKPLIYRINSPDYDVALNILKQEPRPSIEQTNTAVTAFAKQLKMVGEKAFFGSSKSVKTDQQ